MSERIGLVGVGLLGSAIAERLIAEGFQVLGYDLSRRQAFGGVWADAAADVAGQCDRVLLSLPTSDVGAAVLEQIAAALRSGMTIIDTTTGEPEQMAGFGRRLAGRGVAYLDATVGGSSEQLRRREALILAGGEADAFNRCADLFDALSTQVFHVGPCGAGARMKLVFNLVLGLHRAVLAEALGFAAHSGLAPEAALRVLKAGPAYSRVMDIKGAKMLEGEFAPQARLSQHLKDVRLILETGQAAGAALPLSEQHLRILADLEARGFGGADNSAVIRHYWNPDAPSPGERGPTAPSSTSTEGGT